jgi:membrane-associated phospholipid phosphatase
MAVALAAAASGLFLMSAGNLVLDPPSPRLSAPTAGSLEARLSRQLLLGRSDRLFWRIPDRLGLALPAVPLAFYAVDTLALWRTGSSLFLPQDGNPHHRLMAYVEAMGFTFLATGIVKYAVGRPRPYTAAGHDLQGLRSRRSEDNLSFFSGHASTTFGMGAFVAEDSSRTVRRLGVGDTPFDRVMLGTVLPYGLGYGLPALVSFSRLVDQQHWPSDVLLGALCGVAISRLTYALHFDAEGRPRRRRGLSGGLTPAPLPGAAGGFGLVYAGRL